MQGKDNGFKFYAEDTKIERVVTNGYMAKFGKSAAGVIDLTVKVTRPNGGVTSDHYKVAHGYPKLTKAEIEAKAVEYLRGVTNTDLELAE